LTCSEDRRPQRRRGRPRPHFGRCYFSSTPPGSGIAKCCPKPPANVADSRFWHTATLPPCRADVSLLGNRPGGGAARWSASTRSPNGARTPKYLVPVRKENGSEDLPDFMPGKKVYSVYIKCSGTDAMKIIKRERAKDDPSPIDCDSPVAIGKVYVDLVNQKLAVEADDGARWTIAIVEAPCI
jgi:hypothetical protein